MRFCASLCVSFGEILFVFIVSWLGRIPPWIYYYYYYYYYY